MWPATLPIGHRGPRSNPKENAMKNSVSQIKHFLFSLDPNKVRWITALATIAIGIVGINSPGAGSGIGG